jgi:hypothetical protein
LHRFCTLISFLLTLPLQKERSAQNSAPNKTQREKSKKQNAVVIPTLSA